MTTLLIFKVGHVTLDLPLCLKPLSQTHNHILPYAAGRSSRCIILHQYEKESTKYSSFVEQTSDSSVFVNFIALIAYFEGRNTANDS